MKYKAGHISICLASFSRTATTLHHKSRKHGVNIGAPELSSTLQNSWGILFCPGIVVALVLASDVPEFAELWDKPT